MNKKLVLLLISSIIFISFACNRPKKDTKWTDSPTAGLVQIACDQCYEPIIKEQVDVFEALYPQAGIMPIYTDEVSAIDLLMTDSVRLAITSRRLTQEEKDALMTNRKMVVRELRIAQDAVALIIHKDNPDSIISISTFKKVLTGEITDWNQINPSSKLGRIDVLFDNKNSSTIRFAIDSICKGEPLSSGLYAQGTNQQVLNEVAVRKNAMGVIGVNWVSNDQDSTNLSFLSKVTVMEVSHFDNADITNSFKPYQAYIALKSYPMVRDVYALLTDPKSGLSTGFASFLASDTGQRIILRSGILPETPINIKTVNVRNEPIGY